MPDLSHLLSPKSIAIVGASNDSKKIGGIVLKNIQEKYTGKIYPINPKENQINNLNCYPSIKNLPEIPDLTIFAVPAAVVLQLLPEVGDYGCKNVLIFSAGFKEAGEDGKKAEEQLLILCQKYQLNLLGPNCLGFVNTNDNLNATFGSVNLKSDKLSILSQSGAIATSFFDNANSINLGFEYFVTLGNKSVLNENDFLKFLEDKNQKAIGLYLESIVDGQNFINTCQEISTKTPIFLLKPGKSSAAASAMQSHTGSLAGSDEALSAACKQGGLIRAETLEDFFDLSMALTWGNIPQNNNIAIISNAGGPAVISADAVNSTNLKLAKLSEETEKILSQNLPRMAGLHNPIDVLGDALADRFAIALDTVLQEGSVSAVIVILTPQLMTEVDKTAKVITAASQKYQKSIYCSFIGAKQIENGEKILNQAKIPNFNYPEQAIRTLSLVWEWQNWRQNQSRSTQGQSLEIKYSSLADDLIKQRLPDEKLLNTNLTYQIFTEIGIDQPQSIVTNNPEVAENFVENIGWPITLKLSQTNLVHKTETKGVITNINSFIDLRRHWQTLSAMSPNLQVQQQVASGFELLIGFKRDISFGDVLLVAAGGKYVNLINGKSLNLFPLTVEKIKAALINSQLGPIITGYRGDLPVDINRLNQQIIRLGKFFANHPEISDLEINPVIINQDSFSFVDPKIILNV